MVITILKEVSPSNRCPSAERNTMCPYTQKIESPLSSIGPKATAGTVSLVPVLD